MLKNTKIVATVGPASSSIEVLKELAISGVNVFRLNFSHGLHSEHKNVIENIRKIEKDLGRPLAVMQDLQGPKIRLAQLENKILLNKGDKITLYLEGRNVVETKNMMIPVQYDIFPFISKKQRIFINDGLVLLKVVEVHANYANCLVVTSGEISSHKGLNLPDSNFINAAFTQKDKKDLLFGLKNNVDYVALSFVQTEDDIKNLRETIQKNSKTLPKIVAKIETQQAINNLVPIMEETDAVMVARGDLAIEISQEEVPLIQRRIITLARSMATPVIVATQMLESMAVNSQPTRAEVNDVANAVLENTDAIMLSAETATGNHPIEAVKTMSRIATRIEKHINETEINEPSTFITRYTEQTAALAQSATILSKRLKAKAVFNVTPDGFSAIQIAAYRPRMPIVVATNSLLVSRQLCLVYGIHTFTVEKITDSESVISSVIKNAKLSSIIPDEGKIVIVSRLKAKISEESNSIQVTNL